MKSPPEKRNKTRKAGGRRKATPSAARSAAAKKRPPVLLVVAWVLAVILLSSLIYLGEKGSRLPALPADLLAQKAKSGPEVQTAPSGKSAEEVSSKVGKGQERPEVFGSAASHGGDLHPERKSESPLSPAEGVSSKVGKGQDRPEAFGNAASHGGDLHPERKSESPLSPADDSVKPPLNGDLPPLAMVPAPRPPAPRVDVSPKSARAAIVIDDLGPDLEIAKRFATLPFPITFSVLPHQAHSRQIAEMAHLKGIEVILHLPMEPLDPGQNPGRGAILLSMSADEVRRNIWEALDTSPYFDGVNNHMGSRVTRDAEMMRAILAELKARNLFFLDSVTIADSKGWKVARELKMSTLKRDIFLDDNPSEAAVRSQIVRLARAAKTKGTAIAIGHPRAATLKSLQDAAAYLREEGIEIVAARDLIGH